MRLRISFILLILFPFMKLNSIHSIKLYNWPSNLSISGKSYFDNFSTEMATGDINNDGFNDLIFSSPSADPLGRNSAGIVNIILGNSLNQQQTYIDLSSTTADVTILGSEPNEKLGSSLFCSDINNDGFDDILIGSPFANNNTGVFYVFLGNSQIDSLYDFQNYNSYFCKIEGVYNNDQFSKSIGVANFTTSEYPTIFISAPNFSYNQTTNCGIIYLVNFQQLQNGTIDSINPTFFYGIAYNENIGYHIETGNLNGDSFDDLVVGAPKFDSQNLSNNGKIYIINGRNNFSLNSYSINDVASTTIIGDQTNAEIGSLLKIKNINDDDKDDLIFLYANGEAIYTIYGNVNLPDIIELQNYTPDIKITSGTNNRIGNFQAADINNDEISDFLIQIYLNQQPQFYNEKVISIFGNTSLPHIINLDNFQADLEIFAETYNENFGSKIMVSDFNNDHLNDLTIGAPLWQNEKGKSYTVIGGLPYVYNENPYNNQSDVLPNSNISFDIADDEEGIDINSIIVTIAGNTYTISDTNFIYSGTPSNYFILINPTNDFGYSQNVDVNIQASDLAGWNLPTEIYAFSTINDISPPFTANWQPAPNQSNVPVDTDIRFNIYDNGSGVDLNSITVQVNQNIYNINDPNFSYNGSPDNYNIIITNNNNFEYGQTVNITINASDLSSPPNIMTPFNYFFICNQDTIKPFVSFFYPEKQQKVGLNSLIETDLTDYETGINLDNISFELDGIQIIQNCNITDNDTLVIIKYLPSQNTYLNYGEHFVNVSFTDNASIPNQNQFSWNFYCVDDTLPPQIISAFPLPFSTDNPTNTPFYVNISDDLTGVNINSLNLFINGQNIINSENTNISSIENGYNITYNNPERFLGNVDVVIEATDNDSPPNIMDSYSYYFICTKDTISPVIENLNPSDNQQNVPIDSNISLDILDDKTGIDENSIHIYLNDYEITENMQINIISDKRFSLLYNPPNNFTFEDTVRIRVVCSDKAIEPNILDQYYSFKIEKDIIPPYIANEIPKNGEIGVPLDTSINFDILDDGLGVDSTSISISMFVNSSIPNIIEPSISQISNGYHIFFQPLNSFSYKDTVNFVISAQDLSNPPNILNSFVYSFICQDDDDEPPFLFATTPSPSSTDNSINTGIAFEILDKNSGVDLTSLIFKINHNTINNFLYQEVAHSDSIGYKIFYQPTTPFAYNQTVYVNIFAIDLSSNHNILDTSYFFKTEKDTIPPIIVSCYPKPFGEGYSNSNIFIRFFDSQSGINIKSFQLFLDNTHISTYNDSLFSDYYTINYQNHEPFSENSNKTIHVYIEDNIGNYLDSTYVIHIKKDNFQPYLKIKKPQTDKLTLNDTLIFDILDKGTGVNKNSIEIYINNRKINNYSVLDKPYGYNPDSLGYRIFYNIKSPKYYKGQLITLTTKCEDLSNNNSYLTSNFKIDLAHSSKLTIVPKVITPNNDGWNDECRVVILSEKNLSNSSLYIYSLDGYLINKLKMQKSNDNQYETIWNGKYKNKNKYVTSGIYIAKLRVNSKIYQGVIVVAH